MEISELDRIICGEIWTSNEAWRNLLYLCDACGHRFTGSSGYKQAAEYVAAKFKEYGLENVVLEPFAARGWERGPAEITLLGYEPRAVRCIALPYCIPCDVELKLLNLGTGTPEEIAQQKGNIPGKAVIVSSNMPPGDKRWIHRMEKYMRALEAGAAAFLFVNGEPGDMPITGGLPEKGATIPGVGLSYEDGEALVRLLQVDDSQRIRLKVESASSPVVSWNVVGDIPGAEAADEIVMVGGHLDSHDLCAGATDNASGIALILEAARVLGKMRGQLARTVRFVAFGVEELGLIGSAAYAGAHIAELPKVQFMLNLDMTGASIANALSLQGCPELMPYFKELSQKMAYELAVTPMFHPYSDHFAFVLAGVPAGSLGHMGDAPRKSYAHTPADTVDKVLPIELQVSSMATTRILLRLAQDCDWKPAHKSSDEVRALLEKSPFVDALRYQGQWPWAEKG